MRRIKGILFAGTAFTAALVAQSASAADQPPLRREPPPLVAASQWEGLYASVSAGGTWLRGDYSQQRNRTSTSTLAGGLVGSPPSPFNIQNSTSADGFSTTGRDKAAVFTFGMGYNVVYGGWLFGIQSEVSRNVGQIHMTGSGSNSSQSSTLSQAGPVPVGGPPPPLVLTNTQSNSGTSSNENVLHHDWTVSEMAKIGFLVNQQWLVYGLVGASIGGFAVSGAGLDQQTAFTTWGGTYGGGVERDFGWLRAFVQVKTTNYRSKEVAVPANSSGTFTNTDPTPPASFSTQTSSTTGSETRRLSVNETVITAGITIPINLSGLRY